MTRSLHVALPALLFLLGSGCALEPAPVPPADAGVTPATPPVTTRATVGAVVPEQPPAPSEGDRPLAQEPPTPAPEDRPSFRPVTENETFMTIGGIPRYKIGPGDLLEILLSTRAVQERQTAAVRASGTITVAFVEVEVAGLTTEQAGDAIRAKLAPFYKQIGVEVLVTEYNSKKVTVLGALAGKAGALPLKGKTTVLDVLAEVGGPGADADLERVRVVRPDAPSVTVNFFRILEEPLAQMLVVDAGDVVFVPPRGAIPGVPGVPGAPPEARRIFILGEVRNPGAFPLIPNMRLSQALALAGGPTDVAVLESARIVRGDFTNPNHVELVEVDFRKVLEEGDRSQDLPLHPGDLIVLPRSGFGNWNAFIAKIRPTLEVLTLPLSLPVQIKVLGD